MRHCQRRSESRENSTKWSTGNRATKSPRPVVGGVERGVVDLLGDGDVRVVREVERALERAAAGWPSRVPRSPRPRARPARTPPARSAGTCPVPARCMTKGRPAAATAVRCFSIAGRSLVVHGGRRQQRDVRPDEFGRGVADAAPPVGQDGRVRLRDGDRHPDHGPVRHHDSSTRREESDRGVRGRQRRGRDLARLGSRRRRAGGRARPGRRAVPGCARRTARRTRPPRPRRPSSSAP